MFELKIKGNNFTELKEAIAELNAELNHNDYKENDTYDVKEVAGLSAGSVNTVETSIDALESVKKLNDADRDRACEEYNKIITEANNNLAEGIEKLIKPVLANELLKEIRKEKAEDNQELDSEGLPWDKRIHSSSRAKVKSGAWRTKRNLDEDLLDEVKAELKQAQALKENPIEIPAAPIDETTPVIEDSPLVIPVIEEAPVVVTPTPAAPPVMVTGGHSIDTFKTNFPMILAGLISENKVTPEYLKSLQDYFKVDQIWNISDEQKEEMFNSFVEYGFIVKVG